MVTKWIIHNKQWLRGLTICIIVLCTIKIIIIILLLLYIKTEQRSESAH